VQSSLSGSLFNDPAATPITPRSALPLKRAMFSAAAPLPSSYEF
jgi:hypothetical protein